MATAAPSGKAPESTPFVRDISRAKEDEVVARVIPALDQVMRAAAQAGAASIVFYEHNLKSACPAYQSHHRAALVARALKMAGASARSREEDVCTEGCGGSWWACTAWTCGGCCVPCACHDTLIQITWTASGSHPHPMSADVYKVNFTGSRCFGASVRTAPPPTMASRRYPCGPT